MCIVLGSIVVSAYRTAIGQTVRAIERRAVHLRNQIVVVVVISALVVIAAIVARSAAVLWAWLLLVAICGLFFHADSRLLNRWRFAVLTHWTARALDFAAFRESIRAIPGLPKGTTEGMLVTLPSCGALVAEQKILAPTRQAIAAASLAVHRGRADRLLLNVVASAVVVGVLLATLWMRTWVPLVGLSTLALVPAVRAWTGRRRQARLETEVAACRAEQGFSEADYERIRSGIC
jgi:hypothetical protein